MPNHISRADPGIRKSFLYLLFASIWICVHSYRGIMHDGILYLGQALFHLFPDLYRNDLFFRYGSQDQFTLFSPIYAWAISHLGIGSGSIVLYIAAQCLFVLALLLCCTRLYGSQVGIWAAIAIAVTPRLYGGFHVFSYSEQFLTARSFAEPLCLFAVWFMLTHRPARAVLMFLCALLIHPLMALPCLVVWWVFMVCHDRRWMWLLALLPVAPLLGYAGLAPFDKLLQSYDPVWWSSVWNITPQVIPLEWSASDWTTVAFDVVLILFARHFMDRFARLFFSSLLIAAGLCFAVSLFGTSSLKNILLTSLQLWRAHWVLHLFAISVIPFTVLSLWPLRGLARFGAMFIVAGTYLLPYPGALGAALLAMAIYRWHTKSVQITPFLKCVLWAALILMIAFKCGSKIMLALHSDAILEGSTASEGMNMALSLLFAFPAYYIWALGFAWLARHERFRLPAYAVLCLILIVVVSTWDRRTPWQKYLDEEHAQSHPFQPYIEKGKEVYWYGDLLAPWILLKAPSYFESDQGGGVAFNRKTAMAYSEKSKALAALHFQMEICNITDVLKNSGECRPSSDVVRTACKTSSSLSAMIFPWRVDGLIGREWTPSLPGDDRKNSYFLYECAPFRD